MNRMLDAQLVEGEIGLVIDYEAGAATAKDVLGVALGMIGALDALDHQLLSSINTTLEPVSILNDVQRSSLKLILARALKHIPDDEIRNLEWKKWIGHLLVVAKYRLLSDIEADTPQLEQTLRSLAPLYDEAPEDLAGFKPPAVSEISQALDAVTRARAALPHQRIVVQTDMGDVELPYLYTAPSAEVSESVQSLSNQGVEIFKIRAPDMIGNAMWQVMRGGRNVRVKILHRQWLEQYRQRKISILPGDGIKCRFEETISYDAAGNEVERIVCITEVLEVISPPKQSPLF